MSERIFDVAVIGGGLVGTVIALCLSRHGFDVAMIEAAAPTIQREPGFDGRAYAVAPGSANLLRVLDVWDNVQARAEQITRIEVADQTPGPVPPAALHFDPAEIGASALGWIVEDRWLRTAVLDALAASDVHHLAPASVASVTPSQGTTEIAMDAGAIRARAVVACDGRKSPLARAAGIRYLDWPYRQTGLVAALACEHPHGGVARQAFFPAGPFAVLPLPDNRVSLVWSEGTERAADLQAMPDDIWLSEVAARLDGRLGEISLVGKRWAYPLSFNLAQNYAADRLVVAGDAAHGVHPIAGQGMNMGLRDAAALTEVLIEAARRGEDIGALPVLQRFEQWRRPDAAMMALGMDGLNRIFSTDAAPLQAIRNLGLELAGRSGTARRFFMRAASGNVTNAPKLLTGRVI